MRWTRTTSEMRILHGSRGGRLRALLTGIVGLAVAVSSLASIAPAQADQANNVAPVRVRA